MHIRRSLSTFVLLALATVSHAAPVATELWRQGYSVIPTPQEVQVQDGNVVLNETWTVDCAAIGKDHIAARTLVDGVLLQCRMALRTDSPGDRTIRLSLKPGAVLSGLGREIDRQAYILQIQPDSIEIVGNDHPGLFYGVQTLLQLLRESPSGAWRLPAARIRDWPKLQLRVLHWDTKHHQDRMETLKRYIDWSAKFKVNAVAFELEDKFEYPSHPIIGAPGAFTTEQMQELVAYGLERFVQIIPDVQAPAHLCYVLKHPEFAHLRADGSNYQACLCDEETYELIFSMYDDLVRATEGVDYFLVSTDEVYYAGICGKCERPYNEENRSLAWVEFVNRAHEHFQPYRRRVIVWAEYPLLPKHIPLLPPDLIDGVLGNEADFIQTENKHGIRQLAYTSMQGGEKLFPNHFDWTPDGTLRSGRLRQTFQTLSVDAWQGNPIGTFGAAWDDCGLHNETFWLGWATVAEYGWSPGTPTVEQFAAEFMRTYYGPDVTHMIDLYRRLQTGARFWESSWDRIPSRIRPRAYGNSDGKGIGGNRYDYSLDLPKIPRLPELDNEPFFSTRYADVLREAQVHLSENGRLIQDLHDNLSRATRNLYNLEVFLVLAEFQRQHLQLLFRLARIEQTLSQAHESAQKQRHRQALNRMRQAYNLVDDTRSDLNAIYTNLKTVYERSRYPKGRSVGGRSFVHIMDDVKDHFADRRPDLRFMIAPYEELGLDRWQARLSSVIESYADRHGLTVEK